MTVTSVPRLDHRWPGRRARATVTRDSDYSDARASSTEPQLPAARAAAVAAAGPLRNFKLNASDTSSSSCQ
jgi:hypothetical protein